MKNLVDTTRFQSGPVDLRESFRHAKSVRRVCLPLLDSHSVRRGVLNEKTSTDDKTEITSSPTVGLEHRQRLCKSFPRH